jgi:hypothetical protein
VTIYRLLALVLLLTLGGCSAIENAVTPGGPAAEAVTQQTVQNGRFIALIGQRQQFAPPFLGVPGTNFYVLRSWVDTRSGQQTTQLYVEDSYNGDERRYNAAHDGGAVNFVPISRNEIGCEQGCSYAEEFAADLPAPLLEAHRAGLIVVFSAKSGPDLTIAVPGELIEKQVAAITAARATLPAAGATAAPHTP